MPKKTAQQLLQSFGGTITQNELEQFENAGYDIDKAKNYAKNTGGVSFNSNAQTYYSAGGAAGAATTAAAAAAPPPSGNTDGLYSFDGQFMSQDEFNYKAAYGLSELNGQIQSNLQTLINQGSANVANISANAQMYGYTTQANAQKYVADKAGESAKDVANIQAQNNINLQAIVNAGLQDVAKIQGETSRDVEKTRGEFGVKQEETRQRGSRDIARIGGEAGIYQGLLGAFNF
jgi:hypothetical protein